MAAISKIPTALDGELLRLTRDRTTSDGIAAWLLREHNIKTSSRAVRRRLVTVNGRAMDAAKQAMQEEVRKAFAPLLQESRPEAVRLIEKRLTGRNSEGWVYVVQAKADPTGPVKVGFSSREPRGLKGRLQELQTSSPYELHVLCVIPGTRSTESEMHARFGSARLSGEWFTWTAEVQAWVEALICHDWAL